MNKKRVLEWGAIIGLVTGVVGLGTALITSNDARHKADEQAKADRRIYDQNLELRQREYEQNAELQRRAIEEQQKMLAAQTHAKSCELHDRAIAATNDDFDALYREHGQLMSFMRSCLRNKGSQDQGNCLVTVCAGAAILANSNCIEVASRVSSLEEKMKTESNLAKADQCEVASSAASSYFNEGQTQTQ